MQFDFANLHETTETHPKCLTENKSHNKKEDSQYFYIPKFPIKIKNGKLKRIGLHFLCGFLQCPKIDHGSLHDEIGNPHNGVMSTTQVYRPQNAGHTQGRAAAELVFVSGPTELINYENEQYYSFALTIIIQTPNTKNL